MAVFSCIPRAVFNTATLTSSYQPLNGAGFGGIVRMLKIFNAGNATPVAGSVGGIDISYDGVNDHDFYPSGGTLILDLEANHGTAASNSMGEYRGRQSQIIWGKLPTGTAAGAGNLYIIGYQ